MEYIPFILSGGVLLIAFITMTLLPSKYLYVREHEIHVKSIERQLDSLKERLNLLEQTRPTTGELEAKLATQKENRDRSCKS